MADLTRIKKIKCTENHEHEIDAIAWDGYETSDLATIDGRDLLEGGDITTIREISYNELVYCRDNSLLIPGKQYRIIDYISEEGDTQYQLHPFDIIVTADTTDSLNEKARACLNNGDTYFSENGANLDAWQIWYCLDNDRNRFDWADDNVRGRGVIYRMIDEWGNDCPYDFKNIQFVRWCYESDDVLPTIDCVDSDTQTLKKFYTFSYIDENGEIHDYSVKGNNGSFTPYQTDLGVGVYKNIIAPHYIYTGFGGDPINHPRQSLNNIVFVNTMGSVVCENTFDIDCYKNTLGSTVQKNTFGMGCYNNVLGDRCCDNTFGNDCYTITFDNDCRSNTFGNGCYENTFHSLCASNTFSVGCYSNTFELLCSCNTFGSSCYNNTFGDNCCDNTFGNRCYDNGFSNGCHRNTFGDDCNGNTFGVGCVSNTFGSDCATNTFGNECNTNTFGVECHTNTFGDKCFDNTFDNTCYENTFGKNCSNNNFIGSCYRNVFGDHCYVNILKDSNKNNTFGSNCYKNTFGSGCYYNDCGINFNNNTFGSNCYNNIFGSDCRYITFGDRCYNNTFKSNCSNIKFGSICYNNTFGNSCSYNYFGNSTQNNNIGNNCLYIIFGTSTTNLISYYRNIIVDSYNRYIKLQCTTTTSGTKYYQNVRICLGVNNSASYRTIADVNVGQAYETTVRSNNSITRNI